jgi:tetratricopeptide (TPR) repeat protein
MKYLVVTAVAVLAAAGGAFAVRSWHEAPRPEAAVTPQPSPPTVSVPVQPAPAQAQQPVSPPSEEVLKVCRQGDEAVLANKPAEARALYEQAYRMQPDFIPSLFGVASTYVAEGNYEQAIRIYRDIRKVRPEDEAVRQQILNLENLVKQRNKKK